MQRSAHVEAEGHLRKGLETIDDMPDGPERYHREIALRNALGVCLMPIRGFSNQEVADAFSTAATLCERVGDSRGLFVALRGQGQYHMISGDMETAQAHTHRVLDLAGDLDDRDFHIEAHHMGWSALCLSGEFVVARGHAEKGIAISDKDQDHHLTYTYSGHDPGMCCRTFGSLSLAQLGYLDQALTMCQGGMTLAKELAHPFTVAIALWGTGILDVLRREPEAVRQTGETIVAYCGEMGITPIQPLGKAFRGGAGALEGETAAGIRELRQGIDELRAIGTEFSLPSFYAFLGDVCRQCGEVADGLAAIEDGLAMADRNGDHFSLPELHRVKGDLAMARSADNHAEAQASFERALQIAAAQTAKLLELRAAVSLARLWGENGRRADAHALLAPVCGWFTEGFEARDLKEAEALLSELA